MLDRTIAPSHSSTYNINLPQVTRHTLNNGVPLFILNEGKQPVVKLEVLFPFGGIYHESEPATAMLALKMLKEGTSSFSSQELSEKLAHYGAFLEVSPSFDYPSIALYCLSRHLPDILPIFQEIINEATLPNEEFERIRQIELQQIKLQNERSNIVASKKYRNLLFGDSHPYGVLVQEEDLNQRETSDLKDFYNKNLNTIELIISGQVETADFDLINTAFGHFPQTNKVNKVDHQPNFAEARQIIDEKDDALQSSIRMGKLMISKDHDDYIPLLITTHLLGGYFGSRLMKNIREDKGYTYGIYSSLVALKHATYLTIGTDVKKEYRADTLSEIKREITRLQTEPVGAQELDTVKNHMVGHFQSRLNSAFSLAEKFKNVHLHDMDYSYYDNYLSSIKQFTAEDVMNMSNKYLQIGDLNTVVVG